MKNLSYNPSEFSDHDYIALDKLLTDPYSNHLFECGKPGFKVLNVKFIKLEQFIVEFVDKIV